MGQGAALQNIGYDSLPLPFPLEGILAPGQSVVVNASAATLASYGITGGGPMTLMVKDLGSSYAGPYNAVNQGALLASGSIVGFGTLPVFGDGSDGSVVFDGTSVVLGLTPSTGVYTLTRNIYCINMTVGASATIVMAGFEIFCLGTLTNSGIIDWDGAAASGATAGAALSAAVLGASAAGGAGHAGGAGSNGGAQATAGGGSGGAGGAGTGGSGAGTAGAATAPTAAEGGPLPRTLPYLIMGAVLAGTTYTIINGGAGGSGGGDDGTGHGGGGGGGGGVLVIAAFAIVNAGAIHARGGAGGAAGSTNCGGGGGGGGGFVGIVTRNLSGAGTIDANGGAGGAKTGSGVAGAAGSAGNVVQLVA